MTNSQWKALCYVVVLSLATSMYVACGTADKCSKNSDCKTGEVCKKGSDGANACVTEDKKCTSDSDCSGATPKCNTTNGKCEAGPTGCKADSDCAANETCDTASGKCNPKNDKKCQSDADCTDASKPKCDTGSGECKADDTPKGCKADSDCKADETCDTASGKCNPKGGGCKADSDCSGDTPKCNPGNGQCVACIADGDCSAGAACKDNKCSGSTGCKSDADCNNGQTCNTGSGQCETKPGDVKAGGQCNTTDKLCVANHECLNTSSTDPNAAYCFEICTADGDCKDTFRNKCQAVGNRQDGTPLQVCIRESVKDEECGFKGEKQGLCKAGQSPPLYCSNTTNKCAEAVVQKNEGDPCNKQGDNSDPVKICDADSGIACDEATGTCKKAQISDEGGECDPTGANNGGTKILCKTGLTCISFDQGGATRRCHKTCDPKGTGAECTVMGTKCEALLSNGGGLCFDTTCTKDDECAFSNYRCADAQGGGKICLPKPIPGPVGFGGLCKTPVKQFGCATDKDPAALCLRASQNSQNGFCSRNCTQDNTCPEWDDGAGNKIPATCTPIDQMGNKVCLFPCGQPGQKCPTGLTCQQVGGGTETCLAP